MLPTRPSVYDNLNALLAELLSGAQQVLGNNFTAAFLQGSFAVGDWDLDSDVDFLIVIDHDLSETELAGLQALHARIYDINGAWRQHLEGSYFPKALIRQSDPAHTPIWYLNNTARQLELSPHDNTLVLRWVVREHGILLAGADAKTLIDPVGPDSLRNEVRQKMSAWAQEIFTDLDPLDNQWYQPYAVISFCRMLHTLHTGRIESKRAGVEWAKQRVDPRWHGLIQRAWDNRLDVGLKVRMRPNPADVIQSLQFIWYMLEESRRI